jgi:predicted transcriptional regulator
MDGERIYQPPDRILTLQEEGETYLNLLKHGPTTSSPLAKSLKTYRDDAPRTLTELIEKGFGRASLAAPTMRGGGPHIPLSRK